MSKPTPTIQVTFRRTLTAVSIGALCAILGIVLTLATILSPATTGTATAATSDTLNFQARLQSSSGNIVPDGNYHIEFKIHTDLSASGGAQGTCSGACVWQETRTTGNLVRVVNGYFSVNLGSVTPFGTSIDWDQQLWLSMNIGGASGSASWDGEMTPRIKLTGVPYAYTAGELVKRTDASNSTKIVFDTPSGNNTITAPAASGTLCLTSGNCAGVGGTGDITGSGTAGYVARFDGAKNIVNSALYETGGNIGINASATAPNRLSVNLLTTADSLAQVAIGTSAATNKGLVIQGVVNQTADLFQLQNNVGDKGFYFSVGNSSTSEAGGSRMSMYRSYIQSPSNGAGDLIIDRDSSCPGLGSCGVSIRSSATTQLQIKRTDGVRVTTNSVERFYVDNDGNIAQTGTGTFGTGSGTVSLNGDTAIAAGKYLRIIGGTTANRPASPTPGMLFFDTTTNQLLTYANGQWNSNTSRTATRIVAADNSQNKSGADHVVSNADEIAGNADVAINAAIAALPGTGGTVYLMEGTYTIDDSIVVPSNVTISGAGTSTVIMVKADGGVTKNFGVITNNDTTNGNSGIVIKQLKIDGNKSSISASDVSAISMTKVGDAGTNADGVSIDSVTIINAESYSVYFSNTDNSEISNSHMMNGSNEVVINNGSSNILISGSTLRSGGDVINVDTVSNLTVSSSVIEAGGGSRGIWANNLDRLVFTGNRLSGGDIGIRSQSSIDNSIISNNTFKDTTRYALQLHASDRNIIEGNVFDNIATWGTTSAVELADTSYNKVANNTFINSANNALYTIHVWYANYCSNNSITGNTFQDGIATGTFYGISIDNSCGSHYVSGNVSSGNYTGPITTTNSTVVYANQSMGNNGAYVVNRNADSTTSFQLQTGDGTRLLSADSTNDRIVLGQSSTLAGNVTFANASNANTVSIVSGATITSYTLTLPTAQGATGECLTNSDGAGTLTWGSCGGGGGGGGVSSLNSLTGSLSIAGTTDQITVTPSGSTITLSLPQNIATTSSPQFAGMTLTGALSLSGTTTTSFLTPVGSSVPTKINIPIFNPGAYGQILALGLPSGADNTARVISLFDARTGAHQPTIGVFSPDETNLIGFSWDGSNTTSYLKTTGGDVGIRSGTTDVATFGTSSIGLLQDVTVSAGKNLTVGGSLNVTGSATLAANQSLRITGGTTANRPASPTPGMLFFDTTTNQLLTYANGQWNSNTSRTATRIVAADNSQNKSGADHVVSNADEIAGNADVAINAAIAALPGTGGTVYLMEGTYTIDTQISIPSNVTFSGAGTGTIIKLKNGINADFTAINNDDTTNGNTNITIRDFKLDGNKANNSSGTQIALGLTKATPVASVANLYIINFRSYGISLTDSHYASVTTNHVYDNDSAAIFLSTTNDSSISDNILRGNAWGIHLSGSARNKITDNSINSKGDGVYITSGNSNSVTGNQFTGNWGDGIELVNGTSSNNISGNSFSYSDGRAVYVIGSPSNTVSSNNIFNSGYSSIEIGGSANGNLVYANKLEVSGLATGQESSDGIRIASNSDNNSVSDNNISDTGGTGYAISIDSTSDTVYLSDNIFSGTGATAISDAASTTVYANQSTGANGGNIVNRMADSATAFQIQAGDGVRLLTADSSNDRIVLGQSSSLAGNLTFANASNANTVSIVSGVTTTSYSLTLPTALGASGNCLSDTTGTGVLGWTTCGGGGGSSPTLQDAYNNSSSPATILTTASAKNVIIRSGVGFESTGAFQVQDDAGSVALSVDTSNRAVGIGTAAPAGFLDINATSNDQLVILRAASGQSAAIIDVRSFGASDPDLMRLQSNGNLQIGGGNFGTFGQSAASTSSVAALLTSGNVTGSNSYSGGVNIRSGTSALAGTGAINIQSGNAASGNSGNIWIDAGTATGSAGIIQIGTANAGDITIGRTGSTTTMASPVNLNGNTILAANQSLRITGGTTANRPASPTPGMLFFDTTTNQLLTYANGQWNSNTSRTATRIVAADNSQNKSGADHVVSNADEIAGNADVAINAAITALPAGGGTVYLMEGTYTIDTAIAVPNYVTLSGAGKSTVIKLKNSINANFNAIINSDVSTGTGVTIRDLSIDGNKTNQSSGTQYGIYFNGMGAGTGRSGGKIMNVWVNNMYSSGINLVASSNNTISGVSATGNNYDGLELQSGSNHNNLAGNVLHGNQTGFYIWQSAHNIFSNNNVQGNQYGLYLERPTYSSFNGNIIQGNTTAGVIVADQAHNNSFSSNRIHDNGAASSTGHGLSITGGNYNSLSDNYISDTAGAARAINLGSGVTGTHLTSNRFGTGTDGVWHASGPINDAGTGTVYSNQAIGPNGTNVVNRTANSTTAFQFQNASGTSILNVDSTNQRIGIGTTTPNSKLQVVGTSTATSSFNPLTTDYLTVSPTGNSTGNYNARYSSSAILSGNTYSISRVSGLDADAMNSGTGSITTLTGGSMYAGNGGNAAIASLMGANIAVDSWNGAVTESSALKIGSAMTGGTVTDQYGINIYLLNSTGATVANRYGLYIAAPSGSTTTSDYGLYQAGANQQNYLAGSLVVGSNQSLRITGGTTANRPASPTEGMLFFDTDTKQLLTYSNGKWQADRSTATKIVAASNSSQSAKDSADYVADGNGDQTEINAALTAAAGGKVYLMDGTYVSNATILIPNNTTMAGAGRGTLIELADIDTTDNLIENSDTTTGTGVVIRDMRLDGRDDLNTVGTQHGIYFNGMGNGTGASARKGGELINLHIEDFLTNGIYLNASANSSLRDNTVQGNTTYGMRINTTVNINVDNNKILGNGSYGMYLNGATYNTVSSNTIRGNGSDGMYVVSASNFNAITGNTIEGNSSDGIRLNTVVSNVVSGNIIRGNASNGVYISTATDSNTSISGNTLTDNTTRGIYLVNADGVVVSGNTIKGNPIGIELSATHYSSISSNSIAGSTTNGMRISGNYNAISVNKVHDNGGATANNGIYLTNADSNSMTGNDITDTSCTSNCYAINIVNSISDTNYLSGNRFSTTTGTVTINDAGTGTVYANQATGSNGTDIINRTAASTTGIQFQSAAGANILNVDTNNSTVGIGVVSSAAKLNIQGAGSSSSTLAVNVTNSSTTSIFKISDAGFVGIGLGSTTTSARLHIVGSNDVLLRITDSTATATDVLLIADGGATTLRNQTDSTAAFQIQRQNGDSLFTVDSSGSRVLFGKASTVAGTLVLYSVGNANTISITAGTTAASYSLVLPTSVGSAGDCLKNGGTPGVLEWGTCGSGGGGGTGRVTIAPEYAGGTLSADGSNNSGVMTSDHANGRNYYRWTSSSGSTQDYDVIVTNAIPADYVSGFTAFNIAAWRDTNTAANASAAITVELEDGTACATGTVVFSGTTSTWADHSIGALSCTVAANDILVIKINVQAANNGNVRIGKIRFDYTK